MKCPKCGSEMIEDQWGVRDCIECGYAKFPCRHRKVASNILTDTNIVPHHEEKVGGEKDEN